MTAAYPLTWPDHIERSKTREAGRFKTSLSAALKNVEGSLRLFATDSGRKISGLVISSNFTLGVSRPQDPGVAVWFTWDEMQVCIPVDRYSSVESNLQAIHHVLEARRVELRHGTLALVRATFRGFQALPPPPGTTKRAWRIVLGFAAGVPLSAGAVDEQYRRLAKKLHPDVAGGSDAAMAELNAARIEALKELS